LTIILGSKTIVANNVNNNFVNFGASDQKSEVQTTENTNTTGTSVSFGNANKDVSLVAPVAENYFSSVRTRALIDSPIRYDKFPKLKNVPPQLEMDYSRILNKPYFIKNIPWTTASVGNLANISIPTDILTNPLARIPFSASVFYRARLNVVLQVAGTPMHQGCILASAVPLGCLANTIYDMNTRMCAPHAFLYANESTAVNVEVPFYVNSKLQLVDLDGQTVLPATDSADYAQVSLYVLNALLSPTSGSTSLSITAHFMFTELEFYVPHVDVTWVPFVGQSFSQSVTKAIDGVFSVGKKFTSDILDNTRSYIRKWTGLHSPDNPLISEKDAIVFRQNLNTVDATNFYDKLDPYTQFERITTDYTFDTHVDEMHLKELISKPQYLGTFKVDTTDTAGTLLWSRPITPLQEVSDIFYTDFNGDQQYTNISSNLLQTFHYLSRFWKGGIKIYIQSVMSNFHFCKLTLARNYSPANQALTSTPTFDNISNLMMETIEFSAGGQIQEVKLPFCSALNQLPCSTDFTMNAMQHGSYYIYLHQPLVTNGSVATSALFNVYISADDDFDFFGYAVNPLLSGSAYQANPVLSVRESEEVEKSVDLISFKGESATVPNGISTQESLTLQEHANENDSDVYDLRPIKNVRDYTRRMYKVYSKRIAAREADGSYGMVELGVADLLGMTPKNTLDTNYDLREDSTLGIINKMYLGLAGGVKFKVNLNGTAFGEIWYVPPSIVYDRNTRSWASGDALPNVGTALYEPLREMFQFPEFTPPARAYDTAYSVQTVGMERPNYIIPGSGYLMSEEDPGTDTNRMAMMCSQFEFRVPFMSPFRFVGNGTKVKHTGNTSLFNLAANDLGNIVIKYATPINYIPSQAEQPQAVSIEVFCGFDDVARLGYQVLAPNVAIGAYGVGTAPTRSFYQLLPTVSNIAPNVDATPKSTVSSAPTSPGLYSVRATYYTKTT